MEIDYAAWLSLALRWLHLITGIAWIGSSFYFIWLDNALKPAADDKDRAAGVSGEVWAVHGGGFYHKQKYNVAPSNMPADLHWFKWESYFTWISGFLLLCLVYYHGADLFLIDRAKLDLTQWQAIGIGLGFIIGGWIYYDLLCKSPLGSNNAVFAAVWFIALCTAGYVLSKIFTGRGAYIHVGAMIGTVMSANVFMIIIPNQKKVVASLLKGEAPDPSLGKKAKQRSLHNNYMTLPILLIMISNHYPMLFDHAFNWLILAGLMLAAWPIRHFFNLKHKGDVNYAWPAIGVAMVIAIMIASTIPTGNKPAATAAPAEASPVTSAAILGHHCVSCHAAKPTAEGITEAPKGVRFDTEAEIRRHIPQIIEQAVKHDVMPPGNPTNMTAEERAALGAGLARMGH